MPEGTTPANVPRQAGPASKGLRLGSVVIPWWAVGLGAVGLGLVGFLIYRNMQSQGPSNASSGSSAGTPTSPGVSNAGTPSAATLVPLPYPVSSTTTGSTATQASGIAASLAPQWQFGNPSGNYIWEPTNQGESAALASGVQYPQQAYAGPTGGQANILGNYGWQWATVPSGMTAAQYAQYVNTQGASNPSAASMFNTQLPSQAA